MATILDPRLANLPALSSELLKRNVSKFDFLKSKLQLSTSADCTAESRSGDQSKNAGTNGNQSIYSKLIAKHAYDTTQRDQNSIATLLDEEIHKYFLTTVPVDEIDKFDILEYWKKHKKSLPSLALVAKKYLRIPATSTSSERAFSHAGLLISSKRSTISPLLAEKTLFVHDNYDLIISHLVLNK